MDKIQKRTNGLETKIKKNLRRIKQKAYLILTFVLLFVFLTLVGQAIAPRLTSIFLQTVWIIAFIIVVIFFGIGILVFIGLRKEASRILDILVEGSLTIIDVIDFLKEVYRTFILILKDFILFATPALAYASGFLVYYLLLIFYKNVGSSHNVTFITIIITILTIIAAALLNLPEKIKSDEKRWGNEVKTKFTNSFSDAFEVVIAIFFLTMDSTHLFFIPKKLNIAIYANLGDFDLMKRGFSLSNASTTTLTIILASVSIEIIRYSLRVIAVARNYYSNYLDEYLEEPENKLPLLKSAIRKSFIESKDDTLKFISFTTILIAVFLVFPRLKLLAMLVASLTTLILDIFIPKRLVQERGEDLFSRVIFKIFRI